ncbi:hypothetical protein VYU27_005745 [Nannochloropsis oceanica]
MSACLSEPAFLFTYLQPHYPHAHHIGQDIRHDDVWKSGCYEVVSDIRLCLGFVVPVWAGHAVRRRKAWQMSRIYVKSTSSSRRTLKKAFIIISIIMPRCKTDTTTHTFDATSSKTRY